MLLDCWSLVSIICTAPLGCQGIDNVSKRLCVYVCVYVRNKEAATTIEQKTLQHKMKRTNCNRTWDRLAKKQDEMQGKALHWDRTSISRHPESTDYVTCPLQHVTFVHSCFCFCQYNSLKFTVWVRTVGHTEFWRDLETFFYVYLLIWLLTMDCPKSYCV